MDSTTKLQLPYLIAAQAQKHVTHNEALRSLDAIVQMGVLDKDLAAPPGTPADGDAYIVAATPTGAWAGHATHIAAWQDGAWAFYVPREGWIAWVADEDTIYAFDGSAWAASIKLLGINATADATNRLAVKSPASLFDNVGNGHQQKINKATAGDTASTLYQTGHSGRAEYGLTGDDDFHVKVSPDGSAWKEAVVVDRTSGDVAFPQLLPIFILATGQSNFVQAPSMSWTPAPNAYVWNNTVSTDGSVGTAFAAPSVTTMNAAERLASEVARANPGRKVYLLNVSFGGQAIAQWKTGASSPDVYANITANITAALAAAGIGTIDCLAWWQGESDAASPSTYVADFETVMSRFKAETWFPPTTSVIVFGTQDSTVSGGSIPADFNRYQQRTVAAAPDTRTFIYTASLPAALFTGSLHMTAAGYAAVGKLAAEAFIGRHRRPAMPNMVVDAETGAVIIGGGAGSKDGWLGIGIAPVNGMIDAYNASGANFYVSSEGVANFVLQRAANNSGLTNFIGRKARGSIASPAASQSGDGATRFNFQGHDGTSYASVAFLDAFIDGAVSSGSVPGRMVLSTTPSGSVTPVNRVTIKNDGKIGFGASTPTNFASFEGVVAPETDNSYTLGTGAKRFTDVYAVSGTVNTSDERQKTDIADCPLGLSFVLNLRPRTFKRIEGDVEVEWHDEPIEEEVQATEERRIVRTILEIADGVAVERTVERLERVPVFDELPVVDADGNPVLVDGVRKTHAVPRMVKAVVAMRRVKRETPRAGRRTHFGLVAQEVKAALDAAGVSDFAGWVLADKDDPNSAQGLRPDQLLAPLIHAVQELAARVAQLEGRAP